MNEVENRWQNDVTEDEVLGRHGPWQVNRQRVRGMARPVFLVRDTRDGTTRTVFTVAEVETILTTEP